ncbi:conserved hypothetical protein [Trichinella spiralis]|uniref:hypothetical protein n=1 Tax=Trichinella spiralis TaxID=6334 RepID=UPI0001EFE84E|nr:conserved hypothetical protein [Trichinella spiralis]
MNVQRTWTELMKFFLQKMKRKKTEATAEYGSGCLQERLASCQKKVCSLSHRRIYILIVCCFIVAIPSGKRETERKENAPVNTGPVANSDGRANNLLEESGRACSRAAGPLTK